MTKTLLSLGHGLSAQTLTKHLHADGWRVIGTTRKADKAERLRAGGVEPLLWPCDLTEVLPQVRHVLVSAAPDADGDPMLRHAGDLIAKAAPHLEWVGYLSTTGVYGDHDGGWVDEESELDPATVRGQRRVKAEQEWLAIPGLPVHVFRLAGIYGPGRGPFAKLRRGVAHRVIKKNQIFSRIHVDDIAQVLAASIAQPNPGRIYNVCDDDPQPPEVVIEYAAELLGMSPPPAVPFEEADMSPMARSFYSDSKRVRNDRIKDELGVTLKYPDFKSALKAMLEEERAAGAS
ncbi:SDR family oxidoreductase [Cognatishimia maritima]|uniref:Nucleoside-diphosphate-sugar epimerase n=1 Tax=Cognatishimia maritima TaxID=870908 RepID=A0A1M5TA17_9RHOB|nr:SDR family oxidoreductase [Cognatishimia maritima]SHH47625.1 Nucleoside-diphosphate-sugar epimerase [Cognatishimia maritima]